MVSTAARVGSINVLLTTQFGGAVSGLNTFAGAVEKTGARTSRAVGGIDRSVIGMNRTLASIGGRATGFRGLTISALRARDSISQLNSMMLAMSSLLGGLIPTLSGVYFVRMADRAKLLTNNLRTVTEGTSDLRQTTEALFQISQRTRSAFESSATIYARTARATRTLGTSQKDLLRITETIQKSFAVGGATTAEAQGAAIQLSQGIASNRFSGDEFRSVAENAPVLLQGMAKAMGVNIGKLREMAHQGELTAKVVVDAIIKASADIDAEFAKTTSTIGQAVTGLDNAILKYVNNSRNVGVASNAIVGAIQAVTGSVGAIAEALVALGATAVAVFGGRWLNAIRTNMAANTQLLYLRKQQTAAALANAQAEAKAATIQRAAAAAAYEMAKTNTVSASTRVRLGRQLQASYAAEAAALSTVAVAARADDAALRAASVSGRAFAVAGRAASAAWSFIGGPIGAAILAIGAAMYVTERASAAAEDRTRRYSEAVAEAKAKSDGLTPSLDAIARAMYGVADGASAAERSVSLRNAKDDLEAYTDQLRAMAAQANGTAQDFGGNLQREINSLTDKLLSGEMSAKDYADAIKNIENSNPNVSDILVSIASIGEQAAAAMAAILGLSGAISAIGQPAAAKSDRLVAPLTEGQFNQRAGGPYTNDALDKLRRGLKKASGGGRKRGGRADEYQRETDKIREQTQALQGEFDVQSKINPLIDDYGYALAKARTEMDLLNAAKKAGKAITPELRAEIEGLAESYAHATAMAGQLKSEQEKYKESVQFQKDLVKGFFDDVKSALDDGKITIEEWGKIFLNVLDKITDRVLNDLLDALFQANGAASGIGSGGSLLGGGGGILGFLGSLFTGGFFADGGRVNGSGGPRSDTVPIMASNGEFMVNARSAQKYLPLLQAINADRVAGIKKFADGGSITARIAGAASNMADNADRHVTFGFDVDPRTGTLLPFVKSVAEGAAARSARAVATAVPSIVDARTQEARDRRTRAGPPTGGI